MQMDTNKKIYTRDLKQFDQLPNEGPIRRLPQLRDEDDGVQVLDHPLEHLRAQVQLCCGSQ